MTRAEQVEFGFECERSWQLADEDGREKKLLQLVELWPLLSL